MQDQVFADAGREPPGQQSQSGFEKCNQCDQGGKFDDHVDGVAADYRVDHAPGQDRCCHGKRQQ